MNNRIVILDTETTGLSPAAGHRIIEIGCVEMIHRRLTGKTFHHYLQPDRLIDPGAMAVHGITDVFLEGKPRFAEIVEDFKQFIEGAELIIHNAPFDVGFIEHEFKLNKEKRWKKLANHCQIVDTLVIAKKKHPGQRNNLDALCKRYSIDNQHREKHGALLDAEILAEVYLAMTGGQNTLILDELPVESKGSQTDRVEPSHVHSGPRIVIQASNEELSQHEQFLDKIEKKGKRSIWRAFHPV